MDTQETFDEARRDLAVGATELGGKLEVLGVLGRGGLGTVYEVRHLATKHHRALKVLHPRHARSAETVTRLLREATVAAALRSPYVAETYDAGRLDDGSPYVLMELLEGETLRARLDRGPMVPQLATRVVREACEGVAAAHAKGIVHRDLKPENLFLTTSAHDHRVKVLDFGISKFPAGETPSMTATDTLLGTPRYMAPEQTESSHCVDERTDVYALGVVLYEALAGAPPYGQTNFASLVVHIHRGDHTPLLDVAPQVPAALGAIAERAMHVDPEQRFQTVEALAEALLPWTRPATPAHRSEAKAQPRGGHRWALWLAIAAGLALGVVGIRQFGPGEAEATAVGMGDDGSASTPTAPLLETGVSDTALVNGAMDTGKADTGKADTGIADAVPTPVAAIDLTFTGCSPDFSGDLAVNSNTRSITVVNMTGAGRTLIQLELQSERGVVPISTQHRLDTGAVITLRHGVPFTNMAQNLPNVLYGAATDPIGGTLTVTEYDQAAGRVDVEFDAVTLQALASGSTCTLDGRLQMFRLGS